MSSSSARSVPGTHPLQTFVSDYVEKTRQFSRNANLYVLHVIGMDMIHGSFNVLFNLYLLALGFLSLIPALMLRSVETVERPEEQTGGPVPARRGLTTLFSGIRHPRRIAYFVLTSAFIALGTSTVVPLLNVVFHEGDLHAGEGEIGVMFAVGAMALALATLCVPLLADRMLKVDAIAVTRLAALPFVLGMGLLPLVFDEGALLLLMVGASYVGRITIFRMGSPLDDAFNMEVLDARERATNTGFEIAVGSAVSAVAILVGSRLMDSGDFATPFLIMATGYLISTMIYWRVFRPLEISESTHRAEASLAAASAD